MLRMFFAVAAVFLDDFWARVRLTTCDPPTSPGFPWIMSHRDMSATALNDRRSAGMRCRGFLGAPAVRMPG